MTLDQGALVTHIGINADIVPMSIDTGNTRSVLRESVAKKLKLVSQIYHGETVEGFGGFQGAGIAYAHDVHLGAITGQRMSFLTLEHFAGAGHVDGMFGMDYLAPYDIDFDLWGGHLGLYRVVSGCHDPRSAMTGQLYGVDLVNAGDDNDAPEPFVTVTIGGHDFTALINSGADQTIMTADAAARAGLKPVDTGPMTPIKGVGSGTIATRSVIVPALQIGDLTMSKFPVLVTPQQRIGPAGVELGIDFLRNVHVWISRSSGTLIMQYPPVATPE